MDSKFTTNFGDTYEPFKITEYNSRRYDDDCMVAMHRDNTRGSVLILLYSHSYPVDLYEIGASAN